MVTKVPKPNPNETQRVYNELRYDLIAGEFARGQPLTQKSICSRYKTTRAPSRDALERLAGEGFVVRGAARTLNVASYEISDAKALLAIRMCLEATAAWAIKTDNRNPNTEVLKEITSHMRDLCDGGFSVDDRVQFFECDFQFHSNFLESAGYAGASQVLHRSFFGLTLFVGTGIDKADAISICEQHELIIKKLARGSAEDLIRVCRDHVFKATSGWFRSLGNFASDELPQIFKLLAKKR